jgi:serine/threonine protein kinase
LRHEISAGSMFGGKYEIIGELGRGGFGTVYKARQSGLNKLVAIKVLHNSLLVDHVQRARFELEAKSGASLSHPNLVAVFDYGFTEHDEPYLVMEFAEGKSLDKFLATKPALDDLLNIFSQIGKALRYLHECNIVHRDLKTSNILVQEIGGERYARLLDLGIAKVFSGGESNIQLTSTGAIFGSPAFMSPEQCQGHHVDARSDIYSFGCVIYECLSGELPFTGENSLQVVLKHLHNDPEPLSYRTQKEFELTQVVAKCMAKEPTSRYQSMKELLDVLQKIAAIPANQKAQTAGTLSRSYTAVPQPEPSRNNMHLIVAAAAGVFILLAAVFAIPQLMSRTTTVLPPVVVVKEVPAQAPSAIPVTAPAVAPTSSAAAEAEADTVRLQRLAVEKAAAEQAAARLEAEKLALQKASEQLAAEKAASENRATDEAAVRAKYLEKAKALGAVMNQRYELTQQSLRAFDQSSQTMQNGNMSLRQYNDRMSKQNGLGR